MARKKSKPFKDKKEPELKHVVQKTPITKSVRDYMRQQLRCLRQHGTPKYWDSNIETNEDDQPIYPEIPTGAKLLRLSDDKLSTLLEKYTELSSASQAPEIPSPQDKTFDNKINECKTSRHSAQKCRGAEDIVEPPTSTTSSLTCSSSAAVIPSSDHSKKPAKQTFVEEPKKEKKKKVSKRASTYTMELRRQLSFLRKYGSGKYWVEAVKKMREARMLSGTNRPVFPEIPSGKPLRSLSDDALKSMLEKYDSITMVSRPGKTPSSKNKIMMKTRSLSTQECQGAEENAVQRSPTTSKRTSSRSAAVSLTPAPRTKNPVENIVVDGIKKTPKTKISTNDMTTPATTTTRRSKKSSDETPSGGGDLALKELRAADAASSTAEKKRMMTPTEEIVPSSSSQERIGRSAKQDCKKTAHETKNVATSVNHSKNGQNDETYRKPEKRPAEVHGKKIHRVHDTRLTVRSDSVPRKKPRTNDIVKDTKTTSFEFRNLPADAAAASKAEPEPITSTTEKQDIEIPLARETKNLSTVAPLVNQTCTGVSTKSAQETRTNAKPEKQIGEVRNKKISRQSETQLTDCSDSVPRKKSKTHEVVKTTSIEIRNIVSDKKETVNQKKGKRPRSTNASRSNSVAPEMPTTSKEKHLNAPRMLPSKPTSNTVDGNSGEKPKKILKNSSSRQTMLDVDAMISSRLSPILEVQTECSSDVEIDVVSLDKPGHTVEVSETYAALLRETNPIESEASSSEDDRELAEELEVLPFATSGQEDAVNSRLVYEAPLEAENEHEAKPPIDHNQPVPEHNLIAGTIPTLTNEEVSNLSSFKSRGHQLKPSSKGIQADSNVGTSNKGAEMAASSTQMKMGTTKKNQNSHRRREHRIAPMDEFMWPTKNSGTSSISKVPNYSIGLRADITLDEVRAQRHSEALKTSSATLKEKLRAAAMNVRMQSTTACAPTTLSNPSLRDDSIPGRNSASTVERSCDTADIYEQLSSKGTHYEDTPDHVTTVEDYANTSAALVDGANGTNSQLLDAQLDGQEKPMQSLLDDSAPFVEPSSSIVEDDVEEPQHSVLDEPAQDVDQASEQLEADVEEPQQSVLDEPAQDVDQASEQLEADVEEPQQSVLDEPAPDVDQASEQLEADVEEPQQSVLDEPAQDVDQASEQLEAAVEEPQQSVLDEPAQDVDQASEQLEAAVEEPQQSVLDEPAPDADQASEQLEADVEEPQQSVLDEPAQDVDQASEQLEAAVEEPQQSVLDEPAQDVDQASEQLEADVVDAEFEMAHYLATPYVQRSSVGDMSIDEYSRFSCVIEDETPPESIAGDNNFSPSRAKYLMGQIEQDSDGNYDVVEVNDPQNEDLHQNVSTLEIENDGSVRTPLAIGTEVAAEEASPISPVAHTPTDSSAVDEGVDQAGDCLQQHSQAHASAQDWWELEDGSGGFCFNFDIPEDSAKIDIEYSSSRRGSTESKKTHYEKRQAYIELEDGVFVLEGQVRRSPPKPAKTIDMKGSQIGWSNECTDDVTDWTKKCKQEVVDEVDDAALNEAMINSLQVENEDELNEAVLASLQPLASTSGAQMEDDVSSIEQESGSVDEEELQKNAVNVLDPAASTLEAQIGDDISYEQASGSVHDEEQIQDDPLLRDIIQTLETLEENEQKKKQEENAALHLDVDVGDGLLFADEPEEQPLQLNWPDDTEELHLMSANNMVLISEVQPRSIPSNPAQDNTSEITTFGYVATPLPSSIRMRASHSSFENQVDSPRKLEVSKPEWELQYAHVGHLRRPSEEVVCPIMQSPLQSLTTTRDQPIQLHQVSCPPRGANQEEYLRRRRQNSGRAQVDFGYLAAGTTPQPVQSSSASPYPSEFAMIDSGRVCLPRQSGYAPSSEYSSDSPAPPANMPMVTQPHYRLLEQQQQQFISRSVHRGIINSQNNGQVLWNQMNSFQKLSISQNFSTGNDLMQSSVVTSQSPFNVVHSNPSTPQPMMPQSTGVMMPPQWLPPRTPAEAMPHMFHQPLMYPIRNMADPSARRCVPQPMAQPVRPQSIMMQGHHDFGFAASPQQAEAYGSTVQEAGPTSVPGRLSKARKNTRNVKKLAGTPTTSSVQNAPCFYTAQSPVAPGAEMMMLHQNFQTHHAGYFFPGGTFPASLQHGHPHHQIVSHPNYGNAMMSPPPYVPRQG